MGLKNAPQKLNFVIAKATSKSYALDCSCKCPCGWVPTHNTTGSFLIKITLCETTNILFSKNATQS